MNKLFDREYEEWATVQEAAKLAHRIGFDKVVSMIEREWLDLGLQADPRLERQERDDE